MRTLFSWVHQLPFWIKFFWQLVFCGTAATIVSGAVAERVKYISFILFSFVLTLFIYPIVGHWIWGGGWLADMGFQRFCRRHSHYAFGQYSCFSRCYGFRDHASANMEKDGKPKAIPDIT